MFNYETANVMFVCFFFWGGAVRECGLQSLNWGIFFESINVGGGEVRSKRRKVSFYQGSTWGKATKESIISKQSEKMYHLKTFLKCVILKRSERVLF